MFLRIKLELTGIEVEHGALAIIPKAFKTLMEVVEKEIIVISKLHKVLVLKEVEMWLLFWGRLLYLFGEN